MNGIEHDIISRCLHMIYGQLLTEEADVGLRSIERLIFLIRYMAKSEVPTATIQEELHVMQQVFQIYRGEDETEFQVEIRDTDPRMHVGRSTLLYEICQHGMELMHNGCRLQRVVLFQNDSQLAYAFTDMYGQAYGGTVYGEELDPGYRGASD